MALFDMPGTRSSKGADKTIAQKSKVKSAPIVSSVRGTDLASRIQLIIQQAEKRLGQYADEYEAIRDFETLQKYVDDYDSTECPYIALDTETTGLDVINDEIAGLCLYYPKRKAVYIPINHESYITGLRVSNQMDKQAVSQALRTLIDKGAKFIMHHANFDIRVCWYQLGVDISCYFDTQIAAFLLNENEPHGLKPLHEKYVLNGEGDAWSFSDLFKDIPFTKIPIKVAYLYAAHDPHITYELFEFQLPYFTKGTFECAEFGLEKVSEVFWDIEMPFVDVIIDMEKNGISFDFNYQQDLHNKYHSIKNEKLSIFHEELEKYAPQINAYRLANPTAKLDDPISVSSPQQLSILFYDIIQVGEIDRKKPRGTGEDILKQINLPIAQAILDYRGVDKLINTYIDKLPNCVESDGKIHCTFKQYGAKTGRLSSENPNLQNIPSHNKDIRKLFVADEGYVLLSADFSQQEPRSMAALCGDELMLQAYREGKDLYAQIASVAFHRAYEDCLEFYPDGTTNKEGKEYRTQAKSILLGILYGRGVESIAEQLECTPQEAQQIKDAVFLGFPAIKQFEEDSITMAEQLGYVTTFWGRKRRLPEMQLPDYQYEYLDGHGDMDPLSFDVAVDNTVPPELVQKYNRMLRGATFGRKRKIFEKINAEGVRVIDNTMKVQDATRQCVNARIQGTAADMSKKAGIIISQNERLKELGFKLLVPIHDEYLATCPEESIEECSKLFSECMCKAAEDLGMTISCDVEITKAWYGESVV